MNRNHFIAALTLIAVSLVASRAGAAETINRKREKAMSGEITGVSKNEITVKVKVPKEETKTVPANDVESIAWEKMAPEYNLALGDEKGGRFQKALDGYQKALQANKSSNDLVKKDLEFLIARTSGKMALADPSKADDAIKKLEDFRTKNGDHYRFFDTVSLLGQLYAAKNDSVKAKLAFDKLAGAPWKDYQMAAHVATGRLLLAENKLPDAVAEYEKVLAMPAEGPAEESQRQEAVLGKSRVMIVQKQFDEALKLLKEVIDKAPADDVKVNAEAFLRQGDCLREKGNDKDALLSYLLVDVTFSSEKALHAEALYRLVSLWDKAGHKGRADDCRERLKSDYETSEWTKQLKAPAGN